MAVSSNSGYFWYHTPSVTNTCNSVSVTVQFMTSGAGLGNSTAAAHTL